MVSGMMGCIMVAIWLCVNMHPMGSDTDLAATLEEEVIGTKSTSEDGLCCCSVKATLIYYVL